MLSDTTREVGRLYETVRAPGEPSPEYAKRRTFIIDPDGRLVNAYRVTDVQRHPDEVLADVRALVSASG